MLHLEVVTPEKVIYKDEVNEVIVPTVDGHIGILPNHVPLITQIIPGELTIKKSGKDTFLAITGGFLEVANNTVSIIADYAVRSEHIEIAKALEAQKRAEEILKKKSEQMSEKDFALAQGELRKAITELKVARRRRGNINIPGQ